MRFIKKLFTIYYYSRAIDCIQEEEDFKAYDYLKKIDTNIIEEYMNLNLFLKKP